MQESYVAFIATIITGGIVVLFINIVNNSSLNGLIDIYIKWNGNLKESSNEDEAKAMSEVRGIISRELKKLPGEIEYRNKISIKALPVLKVIVALLVALILAFILIYAALSLFLFGWDIVMVFFNLKR